MCYNGTFRFKKLDDSFWNGETFRFADYTTPIFFSDQYKIRSPVTKNPPSRNRKPCFVSPRRQPLCPFGHADVSPWPSAAQRPYVLMFLCSYVFRVSGSRVPATAPALMFPVV